MAQLVIIYPSQFQWSVFLQPSGQSSCFAVNGLPHVVAHIFAARCATLRSSLSVTIVFFRSWLYFAIDLTINVSSSSFFSPSIDRQRQPYSQHRWHSSRHSLASANGYPTLPPGAPQSIHCHTALASHLITWAFTLIQQHHSRFFSIPFFNSHQHHINTAIAHPNFVKTTPGRLDFTLKETGVIICSHLYIRTIISVVYVIYRCNQTANWTKEYDGKICQKSYKSCRY
jgi:hypothetical protein